MRLRLTEFLSAFCANIIISYLGVYVVFCLLGVILLSGTFAIHVSGSIRASRHIHDRLVMAVIGAPLYWADSTPIGRVIARFTQDMR